MDLVDDRLPDLDGSKVLVEKGQIDWLDMSVSIGHREEGCRRTE